MTPTDLDQVLRIERASFPRPWPAQSFLLELTLPRRYYIVARMATAPADGEKEARAPRRWRCFGRAARAAEQPGPVVGYAGLRFGVDEGHIMNLAVHPDYRRRGIGGLLLQDLFDQARRRGVRRLRLEVRVSNVPAQRLYQRYGFRVERRRRHYYSDGEDALVMGVDRLDTPQRRALREALRERLMERLDGEGDRREEVE